MPQRTAKRLLIVGWDAADWKIIDTLIAHGGMSNLRRLIDQGVRANLASLEPRLSPLLWTSVATGKTADKHGILNFFEPDPVGGGLRISSCTSRKTKALWNMFTQFGLRTNVVSWYASHPAEPINGVCVSNLFQEGMPIAKDAVWPIAPGAVHPASWAEKIAQTRMHPAQLAAEDLLPLVPRLTAEHLQHDGRITKLARNLAQCVSVHNAVTTILAEENVWDCTMVFYETIDTIGHNFMQYHPPRMPHVSQEDFDLYNDVMYGLYQFHDMMLGTLMELSGPDTTLILLSDHGFYNDHRRPVIDTKSMSADDRAAMETRWHRPLGVLTMSGPGIKAGQRVFGANLLDIAPTVLALLGLPVGADMVGRVLTEAFESPPEIETTFSWDLMEGDAGQHPPDLRQDPFEAHDAIKQLVDLGYMAAMPEDTQAQFDLAWRETRSNLGTAYLMSSHPENAVAVFEELHAKYPDETRFTLALARSLHVAARYDRCIDVLANRGPDNARPSEFDLLTAEALIALDRQVEAAKVLDGLDPDQARREDLALLLGNLWVSLERWDEAQQRFHLAAEFDPDNAAAHHGLAAVALAQGRHDEAVQLCLRALEIIHFFPAAHFTLGVTLTRMQDFKHAIQAFQTVLSMQPGSLEAHSYLATIYRHLGDRDNAARHREIGERLIRERGTGKTSVDFLKKHAPLGPQEWAKQMSVAPSGE